MEIQATNTVNTSELEEKVKRMYRDVATNPHGTFHFEMGRGLAEKLGYPVTDLDNIPSEAIDSFAGVGYYFDLAAIRKGERVLDLGSGSGMDSFIAARYAAKVDGVDMTDEQLAKAERLCQKAGFKHVQFHKGYIEQLPFENNTFDVVISNGVINLTPFKKEVFRELQRVLKPGGRLAIADIVTDKQLPENVVCNATLWASCIGGASQNDAYREAIEQPGMKIYLVRDNDRYEFLSKSAKGASKDYGVKSVSLLAVKE